MTAHRESWHAVGRTFAGGMGLSKAETKPSKRDKRRRWLTLAGLAVSAGVMVWLAWYVRKNMDIRGALTRLDPVWLLCAVLAVPAAETVDALVFYSMGRRSGQPVRLWGCFRAVFVGELYYRLGPAGAPVQLGLMVDAGFKPVTAGGVYTWKSLAHTTVYALLALAALGCKVGLFGERLGWVTGVAGTVLAGYALVCALGFWAAARPEKTARALQKMFAFLTAKLRFLRRRERGKRLGEKAAEYCAALGGARENQELLWRLFLGVFVELLLLFSIPAYLYFGLGLQGISFLRVTLTACLVMLLARLVALPGNAVGAEGAFYLLMSPYFGGAVTVALVLWRLLTFAWPMALGAGASVLGTARRSAPVSFSS